MLLASYEDTVASISHPQANPEVQFVLQLGNTGTPVDIGAGLGAGLLWGANDDGFIDFTAENSPAFVNIASLATNGADDQFALFVAFANGVPSGYIAPESLLFGSPNDLTGYRIDIIRLHVEDIHFEPQSFPEFDNFIVNASLKYEFFGVRIPEPDMLMLLLAGMILILPALNQPLLRSHIARLQRDGRIWSFPPSTRVIIWNRIKTYVSQNFESTRTLSLTCLVLFGSQTASAEQLAITASNLDGGHGVHDATFTNVKLAKTGTNVIIQAACQADLAGSSNYLQFSLGPSTGSYELVDTWFVSDGHTDCVAPFTFDQATKTITASQWNGYVTGGTPGVVYARAAYSSAVDQYCVACTNCNCFGSPQCDLPQTVITITYTDVECNTSSDCASGLYCFNDLCRPVINSSNPPDGAIDARRPHHPTNTATRYGWDSVELTMSGGASGITADNFSVESTPNTNQPSVSSISISGNDVTVTLNGRIPPGAWTKITYTPGQSSICLGYLPADVDGNGTSAPADILKLIDHINGVVSLNIWQCDVDRSTVCAAADILDLIDLLNGANAYDPWNGFTVGTCSSASFMAGGGSGGEFDQLFPASFLIYLTSTKLADGAAEVEFISVVEGLADWCSNNCSAVVRSEIVKSLEDESLSFQNDVGPKLVPAIITALGD